MEKLKGKLASKGSLLGLSMLLVIVLAAGCGGGDSNLNQSGEGKLEVVTSFYPLYFLVTEIGGDLVSANNLISAGVEPHDWTPKSRDLITASNADLLLYNGAGLERWVDDFRQGLSKDSKVTVKMMSEGISLLDMNDEEAGVASSEDHHDHDYDKDPHTWVSPKSVLIEAANVKDALAEADPEHADIYEQNFATVKGKLEQLDQQYETALSQVPQKNIVVSHQSFGYVARDYGLNQLSIMGLSPEAEPKAQDILNIAKFVKEHGVKYIFFEELVSDQLAKTLASEANVDTMVLNPLEGLTKKQEKEGVTFFDLMASNLQNLEQALQ
ncbi:zinc ABC transporter substrate-binding protein [Paenibacillus sp. HB172176]|uniref:metal ABC transporter solute-binding protein, Zn/Mn family n=1 Tax=Paenibacillus sp. HB172176 TaxID=2493690 RepID=UPI003211E5B7